MKTFTTKHTLHGKWITKFECFNTKKAYDYTSSAPKTKKREEGSKHFNSLKRARKNLIHTINCNVTRYSKFITLTFAKTTLDRNEAFKMFNQFRKNWLRNFGSKIAYCMVTERQHDRGLKENNKGSWHFHLVVFTDKYIRRDLLDKCWPYGWNKIKRVDKVSNLGRYLGKYLTKDMLDKDKTDISLNKKAVTRSYGLKQPTILYDTEIFVADKHLTYQAKYHLYIEEIYKYSFTTTDYNISQVTKKHKKQYIEKDIRFIDNIMYVTDKL